MANLYVDSWIKPTDTTRVCSMNVIDDIVYGESFKIMNPLGEKFWVTYVSTTPSGDLVGRVDNYLVRAAAYNFGDKVVFKRSDIWDAMNNTRGDAATKDIVELMMGFYMEHGRKPTMLEMQTYNIIVS